MPELYGPRASFDTRRAAERFVTHLTRELTAGGLPHWCEVRERAPGAFVPIVHQFDCAGGADCGCGGSAAQSGGNSTSTRE
jgi:hypothetical protein